MRKRTVALFVALVISAGVAFATQGQGKMGQTGKGRPTIDQQVARMKADLNLTDLQTAQVKELLEKQAKDRETWRSSHPAATTEEMRTHRAEMMRQMNEGLKKILTPEQFKKHEELRQQRMKHAPKGPPQG